MSSKALPNLFMLSAAVIALMAALIAGPQPVAANDSQNINRLLNNQVIVSRQIMCVLEKSPCDQLGRQLKARCQCVEGEALCLSNGHKETRAHVNGTDGRLRPEMSAVHDAHAAQRPDAESDSKKRLLNSSLGVGTGRGGHDLQLEQKQNPRAIWDTSKETIQSKRNSCYRVDSGQCPNAGCSTTSQIQQIAELTDDTNKPMAVYLLTETKAHRALHPSTRSL
ncbi:hypothetical protein AND_001796 [Anopheles darlingi]|uniref:Secreted protein n=1 Tax=Anopheles darlingi TaxID=43151 RepID=W5JT18_ANODA|nr:hypothetical protein AND_001796 [Anopheles darlingi]